MTASVPRALAGRYELPPTRDVFYGEGALDRAAEAVIGAAGSRVFVIASPFVEEGLGRLRRRLGSRFAGAFSQVAMHVPIPAVLEAAGAAREAGADALVSIGGGTEIDCTKAVGLCLGAGISDAAQLLTYAVRRRPGGEPDLPAVRVELPPHVAVPTTLAGAESSSMFGITDPVTRQKHVCLHPRFAVAATVLDPHVAAGTPDWLWASSGMRAVDHAVEGVLSARHSPLHDATGLEGLRILRRELVASAHAPDDVRARAACQVGAWLTTYALGTVGVGLSHAIGHQLAPRFGMAHGVTSAVMLPHVMAFNADVTAERLARIAEVMGSGDAVLAMHEFVATLRSAQVATTLAEAGADWAGLEEVATHVSEDPTVETNPKPVGREDILALFRAAWS